MQINRDPILFLTKMCPINVKRDGYLRIIMLMSPTMEIHVWPASV